MPGSPEPDIRVRIRKGPGTMTVAGPGTLVATSGDGEQVRFRGLAVVLCDAGRLIITGPDGQGAAMGAEAHLEADPGASPEPTPGAARYRADGFDHPGWLLLRARPDESPANFEAIAVMRIEEYLPGVVAQEMLARWPRAAYEAQAVCARTYALHDRERARDAGRRFDVEATALDQVYRGISTSPAVNEAVQGTRGMVVTWGGRLLRTYYASTCGGRPNSAADVWPTGRGFEFNLAAPLQGAPRPVYCGDAPLSTWEAAREIDDLVQRLRAWGRSAGHPIKGLGRVQSVDAQGTNASGRPVRYSVTDGGARAFRLTSEELRVACNWPADGLGPVTRANRVHSSDMAVEVGEAQVVFQGRGLGHGVGLCQWCAKGMAESGMDWPSMIECFYPGASVERLY